MGIAIKDMPICMQANPLLNRHDLLSAKLNSGQ